MKESAVRFSCRKCDQIPSQSTYFSKISWGGADPPRREHALHALSVLRALRVPPHPPKKLFNHWAEYFSAWPTTLVSIWPFVQAL